MEKSRDLCSTLFWKYLTLLTQPVLGAPLDSIIFHMNELDSDLTSEWFLVTRKTMFWDVSFSPTFNSNKSQIWWGFWRVWQSVWLAFTMMVSPYIHSPFTWAQLPKTLPGFCFINRILCPGLQGTTSHWHSLLRPLCFEDLQTSSTAPSLSTVCPRPRWQPSWILLHLSHGGLFNPEAAFPMVQQTFPPPLRTRWPHTLSSAAVWTI